MLASGLIIIKRTTRSITERANGVIKKRFYILQTGIRVRSVTRAAELMQCAAILHNLCILFNDNALISWRTNICTLTKDVEFAAEHGEVQEKRRR